MRKLLLLVLCIVFPCVGLAQTGALIPDVTPRYWTGNGNAPLANGFVCTTATGGTTPLSTYSDSLLTVPNDNPITLNQTGFPVHSSAYVSIYLQATQYRITLYAAGTGNDCNGNDVGALIRQVDHVYDFGELIAAGFISLAIPSYTQALLPTAGHAGRLARVTDHCRGIYMDSGTQWVAQNGIVCNVRDFGAKGNGVTDDWAAIQAAEDALISSGVVNTVQSAPGGIVKFPTGTYYITQPISTCHATGCPGDVGRGVPVGTINACVVLQGDDRAPSVLLTDQAIDMVQMYSWSCPSVVEDLYFTSTVVSTGIHVRGNLTSIRRNWLLVNHGIEIESTAVIDTTYTEITDNVCDATQLGGGPGCIVIDTTGGGTGNQSPNNIQITNQSCFGGAWCVQADILYDSRINGLTHNGPGTYAISLTHAHGMVITNVDATGAPVNQQPSDHGLEIINSENIQVSDIKLSKFAASAVLVNASSSVTISNFSFTDNVQTVSATFPYEVTALTSDLALIGGTISNSSGTGHTGHAQRAVFMTGATVGGGSYDLDGITVTGTMLSSTVFEMVAGAGGANRVNIVNNDIRATYTSGIPIVIGATFYLHVSGNVLHGGSPTTWLSSTFANSNNCISHNAVDGGNILLNAVVFTSFYSGCSNGAVPLDDIHASTVNTTSITSSTTGAALSLSTAGGYVRIKEGAAGCMGVAALSGGTVTVATTCVSATSRIFLGAMEGTNGGDVATTARVNGTSFTLTSNNAMDNRNIAWLIFEPVP